MHITYHDFFSEAIALILCVLHCGGSYILEFFDEEKEALCSILNYSERDKFDHLCKDIQNGLPINFTADEHNSDII